jgi:hypothetical protein
MLVEMCDRLRRLAAAERDDIDGGSLRSGDMRTSGTVSECRSNTSSTISPREKMSAKACRMVSPTFNWRWEGSLPLANARPLSRAIMLLLVK